MYPHFAIRKGKLTLSAHRCASCFSTYLCRINKELAQYQPFQSVDKGIAARCLITGSARTRQSITGTIFTERAPAEAAAASIAASNTSYAVMTFPDELSLASPPVSSQTMPSAAICSMLSLTEKYSSSVDMVRCGRVRIGLADKVSISRSIGIIAGTGYRFSVSAFHHRLSSFSFCLYLCRFPRDSEGRCMQVVETRHGNLLGNLT